MDSWPSVPTPGGHALSSVRFVKTAWLKPMAETEAELSALVDQGYQIEHVTPTEEGYLFTLARYEICSCQLQAALDKCHGVGTSGES